MRIEARRFTDLPKGCPVLWGGTPATIVGRHGATEYRVQVGGRLLTTTAAHESQILVTLDSPAAIRAFAPALIVAVRFPEGRYNDSLFPPMPLWDVARDNYVLIGRILDSGALCAYVPRHELVTGDTPEEALLNGLKAALDAAGGAS